MKRATLLSDSMATPHAGPTLRRALTLAFGLAWASGMALCAQTPAAGATPATVGTVVPASGATPDVGTLQELIREWIVLAREQAATSRDWDERKGFLEDERRLLRKANADLAAELERLDAEHAAATERLNAGQVRVEHLDAVAAAAEAAVLHAETDAALWTGRLPELLAASLKPLLTQIEANRERPPRPGDLPARARSVLAFFAELEALDRATHDGRMLVALDDGTQREVEVLLFGTGAGFMVSADRALAGAAKPDPAAGWGWIQDARLAPAVHRVLECHRRERPAAFVDLPLTLVERESGP